MYEWTEFSWWPGCIQAKEKDKIWSCKNISNTSSQNINNSVISNNSGKCEFHYPNWKKEKKNCEIVKNSSKIYNIILSNWKCLDVYGAKYEVWAKVWWWNCNGQANQKFIISDGKFKLYAEPNLCVNGDKVNNCSSVWRVKFWIDSNNNLYGYDNKWIKLWKVKKY